MENSLSLTLLESAFDIITVAGCAVSNPKHVYPKDVVEMWVKMVVQRGSL